MNRKIYYKIASIMLLGMLTMFFLIQITEVPNKRKNGFIRSFSQRKVQLTTHLKRNEAVRLLYADSVNLYIAGKDRHKIWKLDSQMNIADSIMIKLKVKENDLSTYEILIDPPFIKICSNNHSSIFVYKLDKGELVTTLKLNAPLFSRIISTDLQNIVIRAFTSDRRFQKFQKVNIKGTIIGSNNELNQGDDAGLSTDGVLCYDKSVNQLYYVQRYQNRFFSMDNNLNVLYRSKTIDTTNTNTMTANPSTNISGKATLKATYAIRNINKGAYASDGRLYILSALKADNEDLKNFEKNSVIDIYKAKSGRYIESLYVPHFKGEKLKQFCISRNQIVCTYKGYIAKYKISK